MRAQVNGKSRSVLRSGLRLYMVNEQTGWAIGTGKSSLGSVLHTSDGGKQWKQVTPVELPKVDVDYLYILDEETAWLPVWITGTKIIWLYRTIDGGKSWQRFDWYEKAGLGVANMTFSDQEHGWLLVQERNRHENGHVFVLHCTSDGGRTWQKVGPVPVRNAFDMFFTDELTGWLKEMTSTGDRLIGTHDGGQHWSPAFLPAPKGGQRRETLAQWHGLTFFSEHEGTLFAGFGEDPTEDVYLYTTRDGGNTWYRHGNAFPSGVEACRFLDEQHVQAHDLNNEGEKRIVLLTLVGEQWTKTTLHPKGSKGLEDVSFVSAQVGVALIKTAEESLDVYKTSDGGNIWQKISTLPR